MYVFVGINAKVFGLVGWEDGARLYGCWGFEEA